MANSIWPKASKSRVDRSLSAHSVMGLVISALLFIVCLSGTVAVFEDEIGWWEAPQTSPVHTVSPEAARAAADNVLATQPGTTHLYLYLPRSNWPRFVAGGDEGLSTYDAAGRATGRYETPWNDFLIHLHYYLHLPSSIGLILVAVLGVMLVAMSVSGFMAHPRIFRDAFRFRRKGQARLAQADLHNRLSVWTAPFHIAIALTGAMIGLFSIVALVVAQANYEGDTRPLVEAVFGGESAGDDTPAQLADVGTALANMSEAAPDADPFLVVLHDPATLGQHVSIYGEHTDRLIYGETYNFEASGAYTGKLGASDGELGQQLASSVYRLHFGDFGGMLMKLAYGVLGLVLCMIVASGLNIYFLKRAEARRPMRRLESAWAAVVWGTPALLATTLLLSLIGVEGMALTLTFWVGLVFGAGLAAMAGNAEASGRVARILVGAALCAAAILHLALYISSYSNVWILCVTLGFGSLGVVFLADVRKLRTFRRGNLMPAE